MRKNIKNSVLFFPFLSLLLSCNNNANLNNEQTNEEIRQEDNKSDESKKDDTNESTDPNHTPKEDPNDHTKCGHKNEYHINTPSTCQINGVDTYVCLTCGKKVKAERSDKSSHDYSYEIISSSNSRLQLKKVCKTCGNTSGSTSVTKSSNKVAYKTAENIITSNNVGYVISSNNAIRAVPTLGYEFLQWSDGSTEDTRSVSDSSLIAIFKHKSTDLPVLSINLSNGVALSNVKRDVYKEATFECENCDEEATLTGTFKGRGNGSWVGASGKSGYTFKLDSKKKIFGMDCKSKKWNIIANKDDDSMHINYAAYNMARDALPGIEWQTQTKFIEVYINYEFRGVYMLTDAIKVENGRVPALSEDNDGDYLYEDTNAGFLVEYDRYATSNSSDKPDDPSGDLEPIENMSYFTVDNFYRDFSVKYPDPDDAVTYGGKIEDSRNKNAVLNIKNTMQNFANILTNGTYEQLAEIVDIPSMMDMYLLHELFKNSDVGWSSFYIYKKPNQNKLFFGPAWDFDLAAYRSRTNTTNGIHIANKTYSGNPTNNTSSVYNDIFIKATKLKNASNEPQFANELNARFASLKENIIKNISNTLGGTDNANLAFALNYARWNTTQTYAWQTTEKYQYSVAILKAFDWLYDRTYWMLNNNFVQ